LRRRRRRRAILAGVIALPALLAAAVVAAAPPPAAPRPIPPGRYPLRATARVDTDRLGRSERALDVLALVAPGAKPGDVTVHLRSQGQECALRARPDPVGDLAFAPGQRCRATLDGEDVRGTFDARLTEGSGELRDGELVLRLRFEVTGTLRTRLAIPGAEALGEAWTPELPLRGVASGTGRGREERAR
jgi:hypothetical protein